MLTVKQHRQAGTTDGQIISYCCPECYQINEFSYTCGFVCSFCKLPVPNISALLRSQTARKMFHRYRRTMSGDRQLYSESAYDDILVAEVEKLITGAP